MPAKDFYKPTDMDTLRMENELLAFEVRFLKAQLAEPERSAAQLKERLAQSERSAAQLRERLAESKRSETQLGERSAELERSAAQLRERLAQSERSAARLQRQLDRAKRSSMPPQRRARLKSAERDLVALLRSMASSPFHRLFRLKKVYRDLEQRYL